MDYCRRNHLSVEAAGILAGLALREAGSGT